MYSMSRYFFTWPRNCGVSGKKVLIRLSKVKKKLKENREGFITTSFIFNSLHKFYCDYENTEDEMTGNVARIFLDRYYKNNSGRQT